MPKVIIIMVLIEIIERHTGKTLLEAEEYEYNLGSYRWGQTTAYMTDIALVDCAKRLFLNDMDYLYRKKFGLTAKLRDKDWVIDAVLMSKRTEPLRDTMDRLNKEKENARA